MTMTLVSTVNAAGIDRFEWTGIPQTGTDLMIVYSIRGTGSTGTNITFEINGSTTGFTGRELEGYSSGAGSNTRNSSWAGYANGTSTTNTFCNGTLYIPNYTSAVAKSHFIDDVTENNSSTSAYQYLAARSWSGTDPITSLAFTGFYFPDYSTASLYIITKGSGGATVS